MKARYIARNPRNSHDPRRLCRCTASPFSRGEPRVVPSNGRIRFLCRHVLPNEFTAVKYHARKSIVNNGFSVPRKTTVLVSRSPSVLPRETSVCLCRPVVVAFRSTRCPISFDGDIPLRATRRIGPGWSQEKHH